ncbi:MAG: hypothetical protein KDI19_14930 [Pseudomonadales bacterium]|nr:hypothetical protein [Pseudomonadales bacterium]
MRYTIAIALALLAGCAGTGPAAESSAPRLAADGSPLVCTREADVGSHMSRRVCRSEREIQMQQEEARRMIERDSAQSATATGEN